MAQATENKNYFDFRKGMVTETSALGDEVGSCRSIVNYQLGIDGSLEKRKGLTYSASDTIAYTVLTPTFGLSVDSLVWRNANGSGRDFVVVRIGPNIYFWDPDFVDLAGRRETNYIDLYLNHGTPGVLETSLHNSEVDFTVSRNKLFVTGTYVEPFYVSFTSGTPNTFPTTSVSIGTRDLIGTKEAVGVQERPASLTTAHNYDLINQGWLVHTVNYITTFQATSTGNKYPSNADIWYLGKYTNSSGNHVFSAAEVELLDFGNTPAPKGHLIFTNIFDTTTATDGRMNRTNPAPTISSTRPESIATFAGRVWYSGPDNSDLGSNIYFSQINTDLSKSGACYQEADPTSEKINDLVDTDGGYIVIPDIGKVYKMVPTLTSLVIFATNGVWTITGSGETSFTATSFAVRKLLDEVLEGKQSVVKVKDHIYFTSKTAIYRVEENPVSGQLSVNDISSEKIGSHFKGLTQYWNNYSQVRPIKAIYNSLTNTISFLVSAIGSWGEYRDVIDYNIDLDAFSTSSLSSSSAIIGAVEAPESSTSDTKIHYMRMVSSDANEVFLATMSSETYLDFSDSTSNVASMDTIYELNEDGQRHKQAPYITTHFKRTENTFTTDGNGDIQLSPESSCTMQARWDWASTTETGKWGTAQQVYRFKRLYMPSGSSGSYDDGYPTVTTKNKVRGRGKALQLRFESPSGKACHFLGYSANFQGNTKV